MTEQQPPHPADPTQQPFTPSADPTQQQFGQTPSYPAYPPAPGVPSSGVPASGAPSYPPASGAPAAPSYPPASGAPYDPASPAYQAYPAPGQPTPGYPAPQDPYTPPGGYPQDPGQAAYTPPGGYPQDPSQAGYAPAGYQQPYSAPPGYPAAGPAYGAPGYGVPGYSPYGPPASDKTNGFAIASLVLGIIGGALLSVIFGILALRQIKERGEKGRGMAITGLVLSGVWAVLACGGIVLGAVLDANDTSSASSSTPFGTIDEPDVTSGGNGSVYELQVGDCVNDLTTNVTVYDIPTTSCDLPHEGEVFAVYDLPAGAYPGDDVADEEAFNGCDERYDSYATKDVEDIQIYYLSPTEDSWLLDRSVVCIATPESGTLTGSLKD